MTIEENFFNYIKFLPFLLIFHNLKGISLCIKGRWRNLGFFNFHQFSFFHLISHCKILWERKIWILFVRCCISSFQVNKKTTFKFLSQSSIGDIQHKSNFFMIKDKKLKVYKSLLRARPRRIFTFSIVRFKSWRASGGRSEILMANCFQHFHLVVKILCFHLSSMHAMWWGVWSLKGKVKANKR